MTPSGAIQALRCSQIYGAQLSNLSPAATAGTQAFLSRSLTTAIPLKVVGFQLSSAITRPAALTLLRNPAIFVTTGEPGVTYLQSATAPNQISLTQSTNVWLSHVYGLSPDATTASYSDAQTSKLMMDLSAPYGLVLDGNNSLNVYVSLERTTLPDQVLMSFSVSVFYVPLS